MVQWRHIGMMLALAAAGCHNIHAKRMPLRIAWRHRQENRSVRAEVADPAARARCLEAGLPPDADAATLAELADACLAAAHQCDSDTARPWFRDAAVYAAFAFAADPECCPRAIEIHNQAVERLLRSAQTRRVRRGRDWQCTFDDVGITLRGTPFLNPCRYTAIWIAADFRLRNIQCDYRDDGFGVPIIARRDNDRECPCEPQDRYYSYRVHAAATAVIRPCGTPADWRGQPVELTLIDPFESRTATIAGRSLPIATDRTTPLAVQEQFSSLEVMRRVGVFRPDAIGRSERGLYMYQPYRTGKIPVVLIHGFFSSPSTWAQLVNHLQNHPELSERYQVWLFLYPTGAPLTVSAAELRATLREAIAFFDPHGADAALRQMVLVGHSQGGLIGKMAVMDSGDRLWQAYFDRPIDEIDASPELKERLRETLCLKPEPYIRRLILIATPHRGSLEACLLPGQIVQQMIHRPKELRDAVHELARQNGPDVVASGVRARRLNGVGGMSPHDPALQALLDLPILVPYHSIIPQITFAGIQLRTDGIVRYRSSHLDGAESEVITKGFHTTHFSCEVTKEIQRILCRNLETTDRAASP